MNSKEFKKILETKTKQLIRNNVDSESTESIIRNLCLKFINKINDSVYDIKRKDINEEFKRLKKEIK